MALDVETRKLLEEAWNVPLFEAIFNRRSRRFGLGMQIKRGPNAYHSEAEPLPLSLEEEAMLCMAATGMSGMNLADMPHTRKEELAGDEVWDGNCNTMLEYDGRTFPSPCGSHGTELFYTNDEGTYLVKIRGTHPERMREIAALDDLEKLVETFKERRTRIGEGRIDLPASMPAFMSFNTWNANQPGTSLFMPVCDVTEELINGLMLFLEQGTYPVDATDGMKPFGCEKWVKEGLAGTPVPYQGLEPLVAFGASNIEVGFLAQNLLLAETALGLGGWPFGGFTAMMALGGTPVCRGLGFRFETPEHGPSAGFPYPIGKDGLFETHHPHYFDGSMDDAVDDVIERKWGARGIFNAANAARAPYKRPGQMEQEIPRTDPAIVQCTKDILNAVYAKYGRFPAVVDPCVMTVMVQAHHLECGFYDQYYREGAYTERHRRHLEKWHGGKRAARKAA
jgi:hypothetical protein